MLNPAPDNSPGERQRPTQHADLSALLQGVNQLTQTCTLWQVCVTVASIRPGPGGAWGGPEANQTVRASVAANPLGRPDLMRGIPPDNGKLMLEAQPPKPLGAGHAKTGNALVIVSVIFLRAPLGVSVGA